MLRSALINRQTYLLKHPKMFGFLSLHHLHKPYLVGFSNKDLCTKAQLYTKHSNQYHLDQHFTQNLLAELPEYQMKQWQQMGIKEMNVNFDGRIHLQKEILELEKRCALHEMTTDEIVLFPFRKQLGVVICKDIVDESYEQLIMSCVVIETNHNR